MNQTLVTFDGAVYSTTAVKKAAYRFLNVFSADISTEGSIIKCALSFISQRDTESIEGIISDFKKEVLDQDLRESLKRETEQVRNLILAHAFSKTGIVSNE
jgi:His-Xaa-Ser system protein HxsD